ncbi:MAG TPA: asparagine synthase (glutamine-hydrolyzing) [Candidatus Paceibacterota bacterium]
MCGVVGFIDKKNKLSKQEFSSVLDKMLNSVVHRGSDGSGVFVKNSIGVAHARLAILDLTNEGIQPMTRNNVTISYNGEIYNFHGIKKQLEKNYKFKSNTDTEALLYLYLEKKNKLFNNLMGMFAFSVIDFNDNTVLLAVDRFGIKPLYYMDTDDWFAWSSEVKSFAYMPKFEFALNGAILAEQFVFRSIADRQTIYKNVFKMLPGEYITHSVRDGETRISRHWNLPIDEYSMFPHEINVSNISGLLESSVQEHMLSDVPVGVQLSGGVDSSLISAILVKNSKLSTRPHSFSIGLDDPKWNEFRYSRIVADQLRTRHHEIIFTEEEFCHKLPIATYHLDEPVNHSHTVPMQILAEYAKNDVTVLLSGEGADEVFGGYIRYKKFLTHTKVEDVDVLLSNAFNVPDEVSKFTSFLPKYGFKFRKDLLRQVFDQSIQRKLSWYDINTYLTPLLVRQDKVGMKSSLENRVPFLDSKLVSAGFCLQDAEKYDGKETKALIKEIALRYLPQDLVYREKVGFGQPLHEWFNNKSGLGAYLDYFFHFQYNPDVFNYIYIKELSIVHKSGIVNYSSVLWTFVTFEIWSLIFIRKMNPADIWFKVKEFQK